MSATNPSSSMNIERLEDETFPDPREKPGGPILLNCFQCVISARQKQGLEPNSAASVGSEMLAAICSLNAPDAVEALVTHGVLIARSLPRETAGVVIALCDGSYSPTAMADYKTV